MTPRYIDKPAIATLLPMSEAIPLMETMFRDLAAGRILQPLRSLMWLPDKKGLLGMMPAYTGTPDANAPETNAPASFLAIKLITIFPTNAAANHPSHQGIIVLFNGDNGAPLMLFDAEEITAIRTAAASAVATNRLATKEASTLAILGTGEQAARHIESISLVRTIKEIRLWGRNKHKAEQLAESKGIKITITDTPQQAVKDADIICTLTAATQPILKGEWIKPGAHLNVVGSCTPNAREVDTEAVVKSKIFTDKYESLFNEAGDFLIPKKEGRITEAAVQGEIGEVLTAAKPSRQHPTDITLFKSLGIAAEDLYSAHHIYMKIQ
ncbi:MAG TPA: ornithine cyclodeaminase family protein [Puia sp.]